MTLREVLEEIKEKEKEEELSEDSIWDNMNITTQGGGIVRKVFNRLRTVFDTSDALMIWEQLVKWVQKNPEPSDEDTACVIYGIMDYSQDKFVKTLNHNTNKQGHIDWNGFARDVYNDDVEARAEAKFAYDKAKLRMRMAANDRALKTLNRGKK